MRRNSAITPGSPPTPRTRRIPGRQEEANPWGLHDMYGNVAEWCIDHYKKDYYESFSLDKPTLQPGDHADGGSMVACGPRRFVGRRGRRSCRSAARRGSDKTWIRLDPQRPQSIWWLTSAEFVGFRVVRPSKSRTTSRASAPRSRARVSEPKWSESSSEVRGQKSERQTR